MKWWDRMPWSSFSESWALSQLFHSLLFTFIKRLFSSSSLSAIRVVSSAYLTLLIFLLAFLIPDRTSSSPVFLMMCSAYKLNKQGDNIQPWYTPFPIWNQSMVPCSVLTVAFWSAYRFLRDRSGGLVFPSLSEFSTVCCDHTVKGFSIVSDAKLDGFLELSCFLYVPMDVSNLISGSSAFYKSSLNIWKFAVHTQLKPCLENLKHYFASMWDECNCVVV